MQRNVCHATQWQGKGRQEYVRGIAEGRGECERWCKNDSRMMRSVVMLLLLLLLLLMLMELLLMLLLMVLR